MSCDYQTSCPKSMTEIPADMRASQASVISTSFTGSTPSTSSAFSTSSIFSASSMPSMPLTPNADPGDVCSLYPGTQLFYLYNPNARKIDTGSFYNVCATSSQDAISRVTAVSDNATLVPGFCSMQGTQTECSFLIVNSDGPSVGGVYFFTKH